MDLLKDPWIPVRSDGGTGSFHLLTYHQLLCEPGNWQVSLSRDDLELACVQLLVCMTQVMFLPEDDKALRTRMASTLSVDDFTAGVKPCQDWFDLDHPTQPFMQSRGVNAERVTPIQKILVGLPEGNNHAFFNEAGEVKKLSGSLTAIALFNQAANANSMGGGFKGNLRGGSNPYLTPVNILVTGSNLRQTIWLNVLTVPRIQNALPQWQSDRSRDQPTWVRPIHANENVKWNEIGLARGLFWQPTSLELVHEPSHNVCDVLGGAPCQVYSGFLKEKFKFSVDGLWPHPHGSRTAIVKDGGLKWRFSSLNTVSPAWTQLAEFVVSRGTNDPDVKEGSVPSGPVSQANDMGYGSLHLLIGGYCAKKASIVGRRHELMSLAQGWRDDKERLPKLVKIGKEAKKVLCTTLSSAVRGNKGKRLKGIGVSIHETAEKLYYARTESLIHETFSDALKPNDWASRRATFAKLIAEHCRAIFEELTDPYAVKPELIPIIAWSRRSLNNDLKKLMEEA